MKGFLAYVTKEEPLILAALASGAIGIGARFGFHPSPTVLAIIGAASTLALNTIARTKVGSPNTMAALIDAADKGLGVAVGSADATVVVAPDPSVQAEAAIGGAAGGAAGATAGGAVGGALGSVLGAVTGAIEQVAEKEKP